MKVTIKILCLYYLLVVSFVVCENEVSPTPTSEALLKFMSKLSSFSLAYASLSSFHAYEASSLSNVAANYKNIITTEECASFFRSIIPYIEENFIDPRAYNKNFCNENQNFCKEMKFFFYVGGREELNQALKNIGIYLKDRRTCKFEMISPGSNEKPKAKEQDVIENNLFSKTTKFSYRPNKCEKYTYFLHALLNSQRISNRTLLIMKGMLEAYMEEHNLIYPHLVQRILYAAYSANQQKHDAKLKQKETLNREGDMFRLYECLHLYDERCSRKTTSLWKSPVYQLPEELTSKPLPITEDEGSLSIVREYKLKAKSVLRNRIKSTSPTKF